ncbi:hypothetical protein F4804DRAFT_297189 [Jackrogersella minutella]|nr:hypothetical protein F4804DRAFT_297189 [Jackrogersella minutella]
MAPTLEHVFTMRVYLHPDITDLGLNASGATRLIAGVASGSIKFENSKIEAQILPPGGDWPLVNFNANSFHIDARVRAKTDAGEIYLHYTGTVALDKGMKKILTKAPDASSTKFGDANWFTKFNVETSDQRLKWMETNVLVSQGRWQIDEKGVAAEYLVYKLNN